MIEGNRNPFLDRGRRSPTTKEGKVLIRALPREGHSCRMIEGSRRVEREHNNRTSFYNTTEKENFIGEGREVLKKGGVSP